jgi:ADP-ribose pyrophosphatase YjhB (NUDIX family)
MERFEGTLVYFVKDGYVLLGRKMKKVGVGLLNTYGGHVEQGELPIVTMLRELEEESKGLRQHGVIVKREETQKVAEILFHNRKDDGTPFDFFVHVYIAKKWDGEFVSTDDIADPQWYQIDSLPPNEEFMPADPFWLPEIFSGKKIRGEAWYGPDQKYLERDVKTEEVDSFSAE